MNEIEITPILSSEKNSRDRKVSLVFLKIFGAGVILLALLGFSVGYFQHRLSIAPQSYEECILQPGSKIQESFPPICVTAEGNYFAQPQGSTAETPREDGSDTPLLVACKRTGCSGQLCVESDSEDVITTCEFRAEYACYQEAPCERQPNGECGFTPSQGLSTCIERVEIPR
jgi:hypothetical protein